MSRYFKVNLEVQVECDSSLSNEGIEECLSFEYGAISSIDSDVLERMKEHNVISAEIEEL